MPRLDTKLGLASGAMRRASAAGTRRQGKRGARHGQVCSQGVDGAGGACTRQGYGRLYPVMSKRIAIARRTVRPEHLAAFHGAVRSAPGYGRGLFAVGPLAAADSFSCARPFHLFAGRRA